MAEPIKSYMSEEDISFMEVFFREMNMSKILADLFPCHVELDFNSSDPWKKTMPWYYTKRGNKIFNYIYIILMTLLILNPVNAISFRNFYFYMSNPLNSTYSISNCTPNSSCNSNSTFISTAVFNNVTGILNSTVTFDSAIFNNVTETYDEFFAYSSALFKLITILFGPIFITVQYRRFKRLMRDRRNFLAANTFIEALVKHSLISLELSAELTAAKSKFFEGRTESYSEIETQDNSVVNQSDILINEENIAASQEDIMTGQNDIMVDQDDTVVDQLDIVVEHEDTVVDQNNIVVEKEDAILNQDIVVNQEEAVIDEEDVIVNRKDIVVDQETVEIDKKDTVVDEKDTVLNREDTVEGLEDEVVNHEDTAGDLEDVVVNHEDTMGDLEDAVVNHEDTVRDLEDVVNHEDTVGDLEDVVVNHEDTVGNLEDVMVKQEDAVEDLEDVVVNQEDTVHQAAESKPGIQVHSETFEIIMFTNMRRKIDYYRFIKHVESIFELLQAVNYMHKRNMYHLDLQPATVCKQDMSNPKYERLLLVLGYDTESEDGWVPYEKVGCTEFYRPPECLEYLEVDAGKVDSWGVGIVAFELLTGGMLAITAGLNEPRIRRCISVLQADFDQRYLSSAINSRYNIIKVFNYIRCLESKFLYKFDETEFLTDCWTFVSGLLKFDPLERLSIEEALNTRLMKKVFPKFEPAYKIE